MEYITVNGVEYAAKSVATTTNQIVMTFESCQIAEMEAAFRRALALTVSGEGKVAYGTYTGLAFEQAAVLANGDIVVTMRIKSAAELRLDAVEEAVAVQDEAIADLGAAVSSLAEGGTANG